MNKEELYNIKDGDTGQQMADGLKKNFEGIIDDSVQEAPKDGKNYVRNNGKWSELPSGEGGSIVVDDELSSESTNPVQNKVVTEKLTELESKTEEIKNTKQDNLTFDKTPTLNSPNPVTSGGIKEALDLQKNEVEAAKDEALNSISERESSAILNFNKQKVTPEMLSQSVKDLINTAGGGTINNMPDEEDIQSVDDGTGSQVLKFNDRAYNPSNFSGKGYKILRKNIDDKGSLSLDEYFIHIPEGKIIKGLKANVYFYDSHAIDQTSNPNYDTSILYPAILSIENNSKILRLDATFSYGGKNSYTLEDKEASLKRMITINENSYVSGRLNTRNKTFILNNYNGKNNYVDGLFNAGNSANRKSINNLIYQYFDLDLSKLLIFNGEKFVTADGLPINVIKQGTFAQKPNSAQGIEVGFQYFCTDKQTREGTTNGIMIYYKGGDVWVDALGRVVE